MLNKVFNTSGGVAQHALPLPPHTKFAIYTCIPVRVISPLPTLDLTSVFCSKHGFRHLCFSYLEACLTSARRRIKRALRAEFTRRSQSRASRVARPLRGIIPVPSYSPPRFSPVNGLDQTKSDNDPPPASLPPRLGIFRTL